MNESGLTIRCLEGFADGRCQPPVWNALLERGPTNVVFLTWEWQKAWWESFDRRGLMLLGAEQNGELVALAPLFAEEGLVYFVGSGGSDYLDFVGPVGTSEVMETLLGGARDLVPGFVGFRFYHLPETSPTADLLRAAAARLGFVVREEGTHAAPRTRWQPQSDEAVALTRKKSLLRHEAWFQRRAAVEVFHFSSARDVAVHLDEFFAQHIDRWRATPHPSLFLDPRHQEFYRRLTRLASSTGWLRFTRIDWAGRPIAFHFGFHYEGVFMWYKPAFAIDLARQSPGEVLIRQLLLRAMAERAHTFDFGLGEEAFKSRFANSCLKVRNLGVYGSEEVIPEPR